MILFQMQLVPIIFIFNTISIHCINLDLETNIPLSMSFNPITDEIYENQSLTVRCEVSGQSNDKVSAVHTFSMFLYCPLAPWNKFCFQNCQSACVGQKFQECPNFDELTRIKCQTVTTQTGHVYYEYVIPRLSKQWFNNELQGFSCKTAGYKTVEIKLRESIKKKEAHQMVPNVHSIITPTPTTIKTTMPVWVRNVINEQKSNDKVDEVYLMGNINPQFKAAVTREVFIVGSVIIVFISLLLNIFCCIRCVLIKQYSKSKRRVHMQHLFCMAEEIRNARLVKQFNSSVELHQKRAELYRLENIVRGGTGALTNNNSNNNTLNDMNNFNGSINAHSQNSNSFLLSRLINGANGGDICHSTNAFGSDYLNNVKCVSPTVCDTNSSITGLIDLQNKLVNSQSNSKYSFSPSQQHSTLQQQQIASAFANFYLQHPHHFQELQQHITNNSELGSIHQAGSDGIGSCFESVGQPDSSLLDVNISNQNLQNLGKTQCTSVETNIIHFIGASTTPIISSAPKIRRTSTPTATNKFPNNQFTNPMETMEFSQFAAVPTRVNLPQQIGSIPAQCLNSANSNPLIMTNQVGVFAPSQSDSGAGSGSGKISIDSETRTTLNPNAAMNNKINTIGTAKSVSLVFQSTNPTDHNRTICDLSSLNGETRNFFQKMDSSCDDNSPNLENKKHIISQNKWKPNSHNLQSDTNHCQTYQNRTDDLDTYMYELTRKRNLQ